MSQPDSNSGTDTVVRTFSTSSATIIERLDSIEEMLKSFHELFNGLSDRLEALETMIGTRR